MWKLRHRKWPAAIALGAMLGTQIAPPTVYANSGQHDGADSTATPIKHLIVLIGENRTFDHVFATYKPKHDESIGNLLSKGLISSDGSPGPNASIATQDQVNTPLPRPTLSPQTTRPPIHLCRHHN